jgi:hypothetical protein
MTLSAERDTKQRDDVVLPRRANYGVGAATTIHKGALVGLNATGFLVPASASATRLVGRAAESVDNSAGAAGDLNCDVEAGCFRWSNSGSSFAATGVSAGLAAYAVDDESVAATSSLTRPLAGYVHEVDSQGVWVVTDPSINATGAGEGVVLFGVHDFVEVDANGDVGNIAAIGGQLASDTTPILRSGATEAEEISWAAGNVDLVSCQVPLPRDFDGRFDVFVDLYVYTGNTVADPATFTVRSSFDLAAQVSDTATDAAASASLHVVTATVAAADAPDSPLTLTLQLEPAAHANDPVQLLGGRIRYRRKAA